MDIRTKAQTVVIAIIMAIAVALGSFHYSLTQEKFRVLQKDFEERLAALTHHFEVDLIMRRYTTELQQILSLEGVVQALRERDHQALYERVSPTWTILKEENPHLSIMHFHRPDGVSLLRMHLPHIYDDPIASVRPSLAKVHAERKPLYYFETGKHGMFLRVFLPIFAHEEYLGAVEMGLDAAYIINGLRQLLGVNGALFIQQEALGILEIDYVKYPPVGGMMCWSEIPLDCDSLGMLPAGYAFPLHSKLTDGNGQTFIAHALNLPVLAGTPKAVVVLLQDISGQEEELRQTLLTHLGGMAIILLIVIQTLNHTTGTMLKRLAHEVYLSGIDSLTQIPNRRKFDERLKQEINRCERYALTFSLAMFDIDFFKQINDRFGHKLGDDVLVEVCSLVKSQIRSSDFLARWGGEEFLIILPGQSLASAKNTAEKLRQLIEYHTFPKKIKLTVSFGVTEFLDQDTPQDIFARSDQNLYHAKSSGRNRTVTDNVTDGLSKKTAENDFRGADDSAASISL